MRRCVQKNLLHLPLAAPVAAVVQINAGFVLRNALVGGVVHGIGGNHQQAIREGGQHRQIDRCGGRIAADAVQRGVPLQLRAGERGAKGSRVVRVARQRVNAFGNWAIAACNAPDLVPLDRKSTRLNSSHMPKSRMPSSA